MAIDKNTRVTITTGDGKGQSGTVFWTGADKYRGGQRLGVRGDDGETYWVSEGDVETTTDAPPAGATYDKGDRVRFRNHGQEGTGTVFWTGESRSTGGQRLGIRDDQSPDDAVWIDARFVSPLSPEDDAGPPPASAPPAGRRAAAPAASSSGPRDDDMPPPRDDAAIDSLAAGGDGGDGGGGDDDIPW